MSSRTPIRPNTTCSACSPPCTEISASWATTTSPSTAGAGPRWTTSSISPSTSKAPRWCGSSRTTAARAASSPRRTRSSRRTSGGRRRSFGRRPGRARRCAYSLPRTSATRAGGSPPTSTRRTRAGRRTRRWRSSTARTPSRARWKTRCARGASPTGERAGGAADDGAAKAIERVMAETGYADRLRLEGEEGEERLENLLELVGAAREFDRAWAGDTAAPADTPPSEAPSLEPKPVVPNPLTQTRAQYLRAVRSAPGSLGSPQASDHPPGDRPDALAALAAAAPDDEDGRADTPLLGFLEQLALVGDADAPGGGDR